MIMKSRKLMAGLVMAGLALFLVSVTAFAAPPQLPKVPVAGPFQGEFTGQVTADRGSKATITLDLTDQNNLVAGTVTLGKGLVVNAGGVCGTAVVPAGTILAEGEKLAKHPRDLSAEATMDVGGMEVTIEVEGELSADGETMDVSAKINTPWMCGRDPVIMGTLTKVS
jgi:hypothetical protein